jgi:tRNA dimethylallyltransferase
MNLAGVKDSRPLSILDCWFLTGATAVGKTGVGIALARRLDAEIISLDSMAIYRGMDIGTATPTADEQAAVRHHLIDFVGPADEYSVAQYVDDAGQTVDEIRSRGKEVVFVGGTPLYLKSLLRGLFDGPPADWDLRHEIEREIELVGQHTLHERLTQIDPVAAAQIHPHDTRRLVRALEVFRATGEPISHQQLQFEEGRPADECRVFVLRRPREELHRRIERRVEAMFEDGLIEEVQGLTSDGRQLGRTASQAVGYREVLDYLAGQYDLATAKERIMARTRRFAKRQGTWFRSLSECRFVEISGNADTTLLAEGIAEAGAEIAR